MWQKTTEDDSRLATDTGIKAFLFNCLFVESNECRMFLFLTSHPVNQCLLTVIRTQNQNSEIYFYNFIYSKRKIIKV